MVWAPFGANKKARPGQWTTKGAIRQQNKKRQAGHWCGTRWGQTQNHALHSGPPTGPSYNKQKRQEGHVVREPLGATKKARPGYWTREGAIRQHKKQRQEGHVVWEPLGANKKARPG